MKRFGFIDFINSLASAKFQKGCLNILSLLYYFVICFYIRTHILSVRHFTIVDILDTHAQVNKVSCK